MLSSVATRGFAVSCEHEARVMCWGCPAPPRGAPWRPPGACVSGARTAATGPIAIGDHLAESTPPGGGDAGDGARQGERPGGDRKGPTPRADTAGTDTDGAAGGAGGHPSSARRRGDVGGSGIAGCHGSGRSLSLSLLPDPDADPRVGAGKANHDKIRPG